MKLTAEHHDGMVAGLDDLLNRYSTVTAEIKAADVVGIPDDDMDAMVERQSELRDLIFSSLKAWMEAQEAPALALAA